MKQLMKMTMSCVVPALLVIRVTCWSANTATDPASPFSSPCKVEELSSCKLHDYVSKNVRRWKHPLSRLVARSGVPTHSVQDILLTEGSPVVVEGKFTYGDLSKDLEDEPVLGFLDTSSGWVPLGEGSTDDNGRVEFTISQPLNIGVYSVQLEVEGDASLAESLLWVLPQGTHLSIFDIDGTLTKSDKEIVRSIETD